MKKCVNCGTVNEPDVRFCVNCGSKLLNSHGLTNNHEHNAGASYQKHGSIDAELANKAKETMQQTKNLAKFIWDKLLYPERMIVIGAILGCIAAIFWGTTVFLLSAFYFLTMFSSLALIYLSQKTSIAKRIELARWQIVIGTFWLPLAVIAMQVMGSINGMIGSLGALTRTSVSTGSLTFSLWLSLFASVLILAGAIMLQGLLLRVFLQPKKNN